jgi:hypothetical protein
LPGVVVLLVQVVTVSLLPGVVVLPFAGVVVLLVQVVVVLVAPGVVVALAPRVVVLLFPGVVVLLFQGVVVLLFPGVVAVLFPGVVEKRTACKRKGTQLGSIVDTVSPARFTDPLETIQPGNYREHRLPSATPGGEADYGGPGVPRLSIERAPGSGAMRAS